MLPGTLFMTTIISCSLVPCSFSLPPPTVPHHSQHNEHPRPSFLPLPCFKFSRPPPFFALIISTPTPRPPSLVLVVMNISLPRLTLILSVAEHPFPPAVLHPQQEYNTIPPLSSPASNMNIFPTHHPSPPSTCGTPPLECAYTMHLFHGHIHACCA